MAFQRSTSEKRKLTAESRVKYSRLCELCAEIQLNISSCAERWVLVRSFGSEEERIFRLLRCERCLCVTDWHRFCVDTWPRRSRRKTDHSNKVEREHGGMNLFTFHHGPWWKNTRAVKETYEGPHSECFLVSCEAFW